MGARRRAGQGMHVIIIMSMARWAGVSALRYLDNTSLHCVTDAYRRFAALAWQDDVNGMAILSNRRDILLGSLSDRIVCFGNEFEQRHLTFSCREPNSFLGQEIICKEQIDAQR